MAAGDPQSKKWQLTINNPQDCGLDRGRLLDILNQFSLDYFALCDEVGANGTPIRTFSCMHTLICDFQPSKTDYRLHTLKKRWVPLGRTEITLPNPASGRTRIKLKHR